MYSNPATQVGPLKNDFRAVSQTDLIEFSLVCDVGYIVGPGELIQSRGFLYSCNFHTWLTVYLIIK